MAQGAVRKEHQAAARQGHLGQCLVYNIIWVLVLRASSVSLALVVFPPADRVQIRARRRRLRHHDHLPEPEFPIWALIILFPMLAALSMSTMATFTNVCAMNISYDILQPLVYRKRGWSDAEDHVLEPRLVARRGVIMIGVAFLIDRLPQGLWDAYYLSSGVLSAGVAVPVFAMFWKRANLSGAFAGSLVGGLTAFIGYFVEKYVLDYNYWPSALAATALGYAVWGVSPAS